jgi:hypothetical protein
MKKRAVAALFAALTLSTSASADATSNAAMGQVDAILSYCSEVNPANAFGYQAFRRSLVKSFGAGSFEAASHTSQYQVAFSTTSKILAQVPRAYGLQACKGSGVPQISGDSAKNSPETHGRYDSDRH